MKYSIARTIRLFRTGLAIPLCLGLTCTPLEAQQTSDTVVITPMTGAPNSFDLIRVGTDEVEVGREGIRMSFSRTKDCALCAGFCLYHSRLRYASD